MMPCRYGRPPGPPIAGVPAPGTATAAAALNFRPAKLLNDKEWSHWSDREIARQCHVGPHLVAQLREELAPVHLAETQDAKRTVSRGGKTFTQNTTNIGKSRGREPNIETPAPRGKASTEPLDPQIARDNENGWISSAL